MTRRLPRPLRRLIALFTWNARDDEMDREMAFHLESMTAEYVRGGMGRADAEQAARRRFGSVLRHKEEGHAVRSSPFIEDIMRDVRQMGRGLLRNYGFAVAVVLTLAVGIGGNTAIFSVVDQLLLRPLPYPEGERLLTVYEAFQSGSGRIGTRRNVVSPANWLDWQRESKTHRVVRSVDVQARRRDDDRRGRAGTLERADRLVRVLPAARGRAVARANDIGRRRSSERAVSSCPQLSALAAAL